MAIGFVYPTPTIAIHHPIFRVKLSPVSTPASYNEVEIAPSWGAERDDSRMVAIDLHWASNGGVSTLRCKRELGEWCADSQEYPWAQGTQHGSRIRLVDEETGTEWFAGLVAMDGPLMQADPDNFSYGLVGYGPELRLQQKVVSGQWFANATVDDAIIAGTSSDTDYVTDNIAQTHLKCVFNQGYRPNMATEGWKLCTSEAITSYDGAVFVGSDRVVVSGGVQKVRAQRWTAYKALRSLVEYIDDYDVISPTATNWGAISATLADKEIGEVDVDGLDLLKAIHSVLSPLGFGFTIEPWSAEPFKHRLIVYSLKNPPAKKRPYFATLGTTAPNAARVEVQRLQFVRDNHNVRNEVTVLGKRKEYQICLSYAPGATELYPCWDTSTTENSLASYADEANRIDFLNSATIGETEHKTIFDRFHTKGAEHNKYAHIWRSFAWNEDGALSQFASAIPDVALKMGQESGTRVRIARPLGKLLEYKDASTAIRKDPVVTLTANGVTVDISDAVQVWPDRAGFTITKDFFTVDQQGAITNQWRPFAKSQDSAAQSALPEGCTLQDITFLTLLHNTIRHGDTTAEIKIYGTIEDDLCVVGEAHRQPNSSWPLLGKIAPRIETLQYRQPGSSSYQVDDSAEADARDDTAAAALYAYQIRDAAEDEMGHGSIVIPFLTRAYPPGTGIPATNGVYMSLHVDGGAKSYCPVVRDVRFRLEETNTTEILLDSPILGVSQ